MKETKISSDRSNEEETISKIRTMRTKLESRIESQHNNQLELLSSLQTLIPNIVSSVDQSLKIISLFNNRPFLPTPLPPPNPNFKNRDDLKQKTALNRKPSTTTLNEELLSVKLSDETEKVSVDESGNPLMVVRSMVAVCLLQRVPFLSIDSSTVLRKLENDQNVTVAEKAALRELGGELGAILAVEMALRSMAHDNGGVELEEFVVDGKSTVMVVGIDRSRLLKELPESSQLPIISSNAANQSQKVNTNGGEVNMGGYGPGVQVSRPMQDMWSGHGESPHMSGLPPLFPGSGPPGQMIGPRGFAPRLMGLTGMPRGMNIQRPQLGNVPMNGQNNVVPQGAKSEEDELKDCEELINKKSYKQLKQLETAIELQDLIHRPTALENLEAAKFKTKGGSQVKEYCTRLTKEDCRAKAGSYIACEKVHFRRIVALHTDINLGDCSFLDTCRHMKTCKYVHYELDSTPDAPSMMLGAAGPQKPLKPQRAEYCSQQELGEAQWINCDIRNFRMDILGQFGVIMADPPWDIHMELPYGTMADDEMRTLNVQSLQTDGLIFLWVTGRAMELGRECLELWGYKRVEEIIWVKTNQLQRIIRTGRTGHWLNHSKEHCLVGIKGNPEVNRNIDTDVIVAEVRETSRKPDEMYPLLERISPRTRKLELFARMHNTMSGWMSLGNQLPGVRLVDDGLRARFKAAYPDVAVEPASPPRVSVMETDSNAAQDRSPFTERIATTDTTFASDNKPIPMEVDMAC